MPKYTMEMVLEYAKVFPENADMGDSDGNDTQRSIAEKGGQYVTNAYFTSEEQIEQLLSEGMKEKNLGHETIKVGNQEFGIGKYIQLKRPVGDLIKRFDNKGKTVEVNYGGPVGVVDLTQGKDNKRWWSYEEDGALGNGTLAQVQFETYRDGAGRRLKNIGVVEHVEYETESTDDGDDLFNMDDV